jgi:hypothetical protein
VFPLKRNSLKRFLYKNINYILEIKGNREVSISFIFIIIQNICGNFILIKVLEVKGGNDMSLKAFNSYEDINRIIEKYSTMVYKLAFARTRNEIDAEDSPRSILKICKEKTSF